MCRRRECVSWHLAVSRIDGQPNAFLQRLRRIPSVTE
jgi:hypothetical protein